MKKSILPILLTAVLLAPGVLLRFNEDYYDSHDQEIAVIWLAGMGISALASGVCLLLLASLLYKGWSPSARDRIKRSLACCGLMAAFGLPFYYWLLLDTL